jgi:hypothetical protein
MRRASGRTLVRICPVYRDAVAVELDWTWRATSSRPDVSFIDSIDARGNHVGWARIKLTTMQPR